MNNMDNLRSYDDVEKVQLYHLDELGQRQYLDAKMKSAESNRDFIISHIYTGKELKVCEVGSGNSKLLYLLEEAGVLESSEGGGYWIRSKQEQIFTRGEIWENSKLKSG